MEYLLIRSHVSLNTWTNYNLNLYPLPRPPLLLLIRTIMIHPLLNLLPLIPIHIAIVVLIVVIAILIVIVIAILLAQFLGRLTFILRLHLHHIHPRHIHLHSTNLDIFNAFSYKILQQSHSKLSHNRRHD